MCRLRRRVRRDRHDLARRSPRRADRFRTDSLDLVRRRRVHLTATAVASHAALFLVLLTCLRAVDGPGADVSGIVVLAVFSLTRLVTLVPVTPGALGVAELSYVAVPTAVGADPTGAAGAVLLFRFLTWFLPIPTGVVTWHQWQAAYPTLSRTGTSRRRASSNASGPHSHQSTGFSACCCR
jgi:uncharacterized protein (TIRG00374 family)